MFFAVLAAVFGPYAVLWVLTCWVTYTYVEDKHNENC